jgi:hypothetical protein
VKSQRKTPPDGGVPCRRKKISDDLWGLRRCFANCLLLRRQNCGWGLRRVRRRSIHPKACCRHQTIHRPRPCRRHSSRGHTKALDDCTSRHRNSARADYRSLDRLKWAAFRLHRHSIADCLRPGYSPAESCPDRCSGSCRPDTRDLGSCRLGWSGLRATFRHCSTDAERSAANQRCGPACARYCLGPRYWERRRSGVGCRRPRDSR